MFIIAYPIMRMREIGMAENFSLLKKSKFSLD